MADKSNVTKTAQEKLGSLENKLEKASGAMPKLTDASKTLVAKAMPWAAGAWGVFALLWAKDLLDYTQRVSTANSEINAAINNLIDIAMPSKTSLWIGLVLFALVGALVIAAFYKGALQSTLASWKFFFYAFLVSVLAGIFWIFMLSKLPGGHGWIATLVGVAGVYSLFQVKSRFNK